MHPHKTPSTMSFTLPDLPYAYDALEVSAQAAGSACSACMLNRGVGMATRRRCGADASPAALEIVRPPQWYQFPIPLCSPLWTPRR